MAQVEKTFACGYDRERLKSALHCSNWLVLAVVVSSQLNYSMMSLSCRRLVLVRLNLPRDFGGGSAYSPKKYNNSPHFSLLPPFFVSYNFTAMDPLSVSASVVGLLGAGAKITSCLWTFATNARDAPQLARHLVFEVADITAALGSLQAYVCGQAQAPGERGALILLEHVLTTLTGCVTTFSDLQTLMDQLNLSPDMGTIDKMKWARQESNIAAIVQRLQNHKSSLTLMLTVLQW